MNWKHFFPFFIFLLFAVVLTLGCFGSNSGQLAEHTTSAKFSKGIFNSSIVINGAEKTDVTLTSQQPAEIGIKIKNDGPNDITSLTIRAIGCVNYYDPKDGVVKRDVLTKGTTDYLSWSVRAPELGNSESFSCPLIFRACFEEKSNGYMEVVIVDENYPEAPSAPNFYYKSGIFTTEPNFGVFRYIKDSDHTMSGTLKIRNTGSGWVDYLSQSAESGLETYKIKKINMSIAPASLLSFSKIAELTPSETANVFSANGKQLILDASNQNLKDYSYLLKLVSGEELDLRIGMTSAQPTEDSSFEVVDYTIDSGYCIDLASINIKLSGR